MHILAKTLGVSLLTLLLVGACDQAASVVPSADSDGPLASLAHPDPAMQLGALERLANTWDPRYAAALLDFVAVTETPSLQQRALALLSSKSGHQFGFDINEWYRWLWAQELADPPGYADFKSMLYRRLDPRFAPYFAAQHPATIRLDEIRWGGVRQDGIPPLRGPTMIAAADADYLDDANVVFGIEVNGDARAYPKRILAWHEMFVDEVGGVPVTGVYCTLCGSMILYESTVGDTVHQLGTSGFLYRSNKLMYDRATNSLWNTLWGTPAVGPLVDQNIRLPRRSVVTTTWGEWRRRHPGTTVLSLDTGYRRDYGEGVAYQAYFATDELMFNTSTSDTRLANKAEVLGLVFGPDVRPLAISAAYAQENPLLQEQIGDREFVVLTDGSGAMRVYETRGTRFVEWDRRDSLRDSNDQAWTQFEDRLVSADGTSLARLPSHSAFWFGWYGAYSNTRLLH